MRAVIYDPAARHGLRLGEAPEPRPGERQALVEVRAIALNFGEVAYLAERRAAHVDDLALVPETLDLGAAAAVPVAGVTALIAVRALGPVLGRRVLVTGASGGVGRMAVQLAARAGAHVIASVGSLERAAGLAELGAAAVVSNLGGVAPVYGVLENVGGELLAQAYALLERDGRLQSIGMASLEPTTIDFERARLRGGGRIEAFNVFSHGGAFGSDLDALLGWAARRELDPQVGWRGSWTRITEGVDALRGRQVRGKVVLDVDQT
jgi:NADPH:quinone reductase-like Zn-dependent oxidoreductase